MQPYTRNVDEYITNRALELSGANIYSESEIAAIISNELEFEISRNVVHGRIYRRRKLVPLELKPRSIMPYYEKYKGYFDGSRPPEPKAIYDFSSGPVKILVPNDLHVPFQHEEALEQAVTENRSADIVITSEISDMFALSTFSKTKHVSFEQEVEEIIRIYEFLSENFPLTVVINSGHAKRLPKYILSRIRSDLLFLVETDLLKLLARPFDNIITVSDVFYALNDALFTHVEKHSSVVPMRSAAKAHEWLQNWKAHLGIQDYRVLVQGHSHHSGIINLPTVQLVETGCLQRIPEWIFNKSPMLAWVHGWAVLYQNNGITNLNATEVVVYRKYM